MLFWMGRAHGCRLGLLVLTACHGFADSRGENGDGGPHSQAGQGHEGGSGGDEVGDGEDTPPLGRGEGNASGGGEGDAGAGGADGTEGMGGEIVPLDTRPDPASWGACQMIPVPPGVTLGMTPLRTTPRVAARCIPAGSAVSRALALMATSTPQKRNKLKILFYGQSITRGGWVPLSESHLRTTFPNADLEIRMEAVGAFAAQDLIRPSEHDVLTWYPDLVIYHNYGGYAAIDDLIQGIRRRTTAEVMLQTQHVTTQPAATQTAYDRESYIYLPDIGARLGVHIVDIRTPWKAHLVQNNLSAQDLTSDGLHLNSAGNALYARITNAELRYDDRVLVDPLRMVNTYEVGRHVRWRGRTLTLEFEGNRVDVLARPGGVLAADLATVRIDGKSPSEFPGAYGITRPNREVDDDWPWRKGGILRVTFDPSAMPRVEDWTLRLTSIDKAGNCTFTVTGSVTGPDGAGTCASSFVSNSRRVVIDRSDFFFARPQNEVYNITIPNGYEVKWKVLALHADRYPPAELDARDTTREHPITVVQGIPNGRHTLELTATGPIPPAIEAIRIYRPPLR